LRSSAHKRRFERLESAANRLGLTLVEAKVESSDDLSRQFTLFASSGANGFLVFANPVLDDLRGKMAEQALRYKLPGAGHQPHYVEAGFLLSYGPSLSAVHTRSAA
jgi:hypothetical protein